MKGSFLDPSNLGNGAAYAPDKNMIQSHGGCRVVNQTKLEVLTNTAVRYVELETQSLMFSVIV